MFFNLKHKLIFTAFIAFSLQMIIPSGNLHSGETDLQMRQQLISFLQSGEILENLPESHPLSPLKDLPALAMTSYYLMEYDTSMLRRFYPQISRLVMERFSNSHTNDTGLLLSTAGKDIKRNIYLSPYMNSFGNSEIYALFLIASRIGNHTDALEYILWSRQFSDLITRSFYNHNDDSFFPLNKNGYYIREYSPEMLMPLIFDRKLDLISKKRIAENCISRWQKSPQKESALFLESPVHKSFIINLLSCLEFFTESASLNTIISAPVYSGKESANVSYRNWIEMLQEKRLSGNTLIKDWTVIASLIHLSSLLEEKSLLTDKKIKLLISDVNTLRNDIGSDYTDLDSYIKSITLINHLLSEMSQISSVLTSKEKLWKVFDEHKWNGLSPRVRQLIAESCRQSIDELMRSKVLLSEKLSAANVLKFNVQFPPSPIVSGSRINFKISLKSPGNNIDMKQVILQIAGNRWKLGNGNQISLTPQGKALTFSGSFSLPPSTELGIVELPLYIDFLTGGKRVEIHKRKSLTLKEGFEATLDFPNGKRINKQLPVNVLLKYTPGHSIQGNLEGNFCDPLNCTPELPCKFLIKSGSSLTKLPLILSSGKALPPGKFPFSLRVYLNGKAIAEFDDILTNPVTWIQLGPLSDQEWILKNGWRYQDDLSKTHVGSNGHTVSWNKVPYGATGKNGEVLLSRLCGTNTGCCLLYTIMKVPYEKEVFFQLNTSNKISLWLNSKPILSDFTPGSSKTQAKLRRGQNSILIAVNWDKPPSPITFEISDKSGLPVAEMKNTINEIAGKFTNLYLENGKNGRASEVTDSPREIKFYITRKDCAKLAVVGSFNSWNPNTSPMSKTDDGKWETTVILSPGKYSYKFLIDNKIRISDPACELKEPDGFGGINSIIIVK